MSIHPNGISVAFAAFGHRIGISWVHEKAIGTQLSGKQFAAAASPLNLNYMLTKIIGFIFALYYFGVLIYGSRINNRLITDFSILW